MDFKMYYAAYILNYVSKSDFIIIRLQAFAAEVTTSIIFRAVVPWSNLQ